MIANLVRQYIAGPIAALYRRVAGGLEPAAVAGAALIGITFFRDQINGGADLETALTSSLIALGTYLVRQNVWPVNSVSVDGVADSPLEAPITGLDAGDYL